ncbi:hypothetical protein [Paeniglutamicibacter sp. Y32M11]|uniref:hypothetical protein n=1 Tax=Paeniglutamicibacter sp. Y32M11 TaxID=2853258 RepID=UPI001C532169|nr:hypothetical protein [Paeniglutamicibacter sp. Y32M11]QXQ08749.1 hypothetical protein KUF55_09320 [Paeniglutamicibacter sp. Y32M11]
MLLDGVDLAVCMFYLPVAEAFGHGVVLSAAARARHCSLQEALPAHVRAAAHGDRKRHSAAVDHLQDAKSITTSSGSGC